MHLSNTYGNKAVEVARMANLTGKRWPVVGNRLVEDFPYIEAEVSQVAMHLSNTYGNKTVEVVQVANLTGKRWPVVGNRLVENFPYIEAEVSMCMQQGCI